VKLPDETLEQGRNASQTAHNTKLSYPNILAFKNSVSLWRDRLIIATIRETVVAVSDSTI